MTKMNSFVKQFVAILTGDDADARAAKVWRQAESALKVNMAALDGDVIAKEDAVTAAQEELRLARLNYGEEITIRRDYIDNLIDAKNNLDNAIEALEDHRAKLAFLKEEHAKLSEEA